MPGRRRIAGSVSTGCATTPGQERSRRFIGAGAFLSLVSLLLTACGSGNASGEQPAVAAALDPASVLSIESIRLTAAGHFLDLRYRVVDPQLANEMLGRGVQPRLIDEATGIALAVPMTAKLGSLRQTQAEQRTGRQYFVLFSNGTGLRSGSRVTAELGELVYEGLVVE